MRVGAQYKVRAESARPPPGGGGVRVISIGSSTSAEAPTHPPSPSLTLSLALLDKVPWNNLGQVVNELHWVDARALDGAAVSAEWIDRAIALLGDDADDAAADAEASGSGSDVYPKFNAFMHSKVQLFVKDLKPFVHSLDAGGVRRDASRGRRRGRRGRRG